MPVEYYLNTLLFKSKEESGMKKNTKAMKAYAEEYALQMKAKSTSQLMKLTKKSLIKQKRVNNVLGLLVNGITYNGWQLCARFNGA